MYAWRKTLACVRAVLYWLTITVPFGWWGAQGLVGDGWDAGFVQGMYIMVGGIVLMLLAHLLGGTLFMGLAEGYMWPGLVSTGSMLIPPVALLAWDRYDGWAWLWVVACGVFAIVLYRALWLALCERFAQHETKTRTLLTAPIPTLVRWATVALSGLYLVLANTIGLPMFAAVVLGALALCSLLALMVLEKSIRREGSRHGIFG